jgi:hypothetical protein
LILSDLIIKAFRHYGVVSAYVYGDFGAGKTSYALWTAYNVFGDWQQVLKHVFFRPEDAVDAMKRAIRSGRRLKLVVMDDAGLWLGRLTWWEEDKIAFMNFFNLIRSVSSGIIFTTPSQELPKQILRKCAFRVSVRPASREEIVRTFGEGGYKELEERVKAFGLDPLFSVAVGYRLKTLPSFIEMVKKEFYDYYPMHYPVMKEYERLRRRALEHYFSKWEELVKGRASKSDARKELFLKAKEMIEGGRDGPEVIRFLTESGIPPTTARRWVSKLSQFCGGGLGGVGQA